MGTVLGNLSICSCLKDNGYEQQIIQKQNREAQRSPNRTHTSSRDYSAVRNLSMPSQAAGYTKFMPTTTLLMSAEILCTQCLNNIEFTDIQTPCLHNFHTKCLIKLLNEQLKRQAVIFLCICHQKLNLNMIKDDIQVQKNQLHNNQLKRIEQKYSKDYQFNHCPNKSCDYFQIIDQVKFCPICLN